jgi:hypothetical protein
MQRKNYYIAMYRFLTVINENAVRDIAVLLFKYTILF